MAKGNKMKKGIAALLSGVLTLSMAVGTIPGTLGNLEEVYAATGSEPSVTAYATKTQLMDSTFAPDADGNAANIGKLAFGKNDEGKTQEWYILGQDSNINGENTVIFTTDPIATNQVFSETYDNREYTENGSSVEVWGNHYGASDLRKVLQDMTSADNTKYFSATEKSLMQETIVKSISISEKEKEYTVSDKLYAPTGRYGSAAIGVGNEGSISLSAKSYWSRSRGEWFWLSYPITASGDHELFADMANKAVNYIKVDDKCAVRPATNLNMSSVLFASSAKAATSDTAVSGKITDGTAMTLRLNGDSKIGTVTYNAAAGQINAQKGSITDNVSLVVQGNDGTNDWYYSKQISGTNNVMVNTDDIAVATGISSDIDLTNCKIWLEVKEDNVIYAVEATATTEIAVTDIPSVEITGIDAPIAAAKLDTTAICGTSGVNTTAPVVTWSPEATYAGYCTSYTASVTLTADANYRFANAVTATVNGKTAISVTRNSDASITVTYTFPETEEEEIIIPPQEEEVKGTGTKADPYIVTTGKEFAKYLPKGYVKLNNDITLAGCEAIDVYTSSGIDLNGNVLDFTGIICSTSGFTDAVYAGSNEFSIIDSNPNKTHDSQYVASDGTIIKGGIITGYNYDTGNSAVFRVVSRNFTMDGGTFFNNTTSDTGACLTIPVYSSATISNVEFYDNKKNGAPGVCIRVFKFDTGISLNVYNCKFVGNSAQSGTAIYSNAENNFIDSCVIKNNNSLYYGAVYTFGAANATVIKDTTIIDNISEYFQDETNTAGVYICNESKFTLDGKVTITGNTIDGVEHNAYSMTPIILGDGFVQESNIGITRSESIKDNYDETVVNAIGDFEDCFTSDIDEAELYIKDGNLNLRKLSHAHNPGTKHEAVAATCVADGSKEYYECTVCGKKIDSDGKIIKNIVIPATGIHTSSDWITDKEATTTSEGSKHKECTACKKVLETGTIAKLENVDPGKLEKRNTDTLALNNDITNLSQSLLTDQERELVKNGADAVVYASLSTEVDKTNLEKVNAALGSLTLGKAYDISLWVQVGDNAARQITSTSEKINLSLKVDDSLINKNSNINRTYKVIRIHDGVATVLDGSFDAVAQMFTFETDQFSTYALVYVDTAVSQEPSVTPPSTTPVPAAPATTPQPAAASPAQSVSSPKTGDTSPSLWMFAIIIIAGVGIAGYGVRRCQRNG